MQKFFFDESMTSYLIIGAPHGKVARHFAYYLSQLKIPYSTWARREQERKELPVLLDQVHNVLILISDAEIEPFYKTHLRGYLGTCYHFSGALEVQGIIGIHPLMTFGSSLYSLELYQRIPFVTSFSHSSSSPSESPPPSLLPGFPNKVYEISSEQKAFYHALCVLGGNFPFLLWQKMELEFERLGLPKGISRPYIQQVLNNFFSLPLDQIQTMQTGPIARGDLTTIQKNLQALDQDPFKTVYKSFVDIFLTTSQHSPKKRRTHEHSGL